MSIGSRLRKARERKNLSQLEVSKRTNINNRTLSRYENNGAEPDFATLRLLSNLYDVPISYFFDEQLTADKYDLEQLLKDKTLTWGDEVLNEEEKQRAIEILNILLNRQKDTN